MAQIADLEQLALSCKNHTSRLYVAEAIGAYHAGSIRSTIIMTWIALYFDLVSKIRSLAAANNPEALEWIESFDADFEKYRPEDPGTIRPLLKREESILNDAQKKFALISPMELVDLRQLRDDRHRCAHPSMRSIAELYNPSPETARMHLRHAIEFVMSRPAIQGQMAVDRTLELIRDEGFPNTREAATEVLRSSLLPTMQPEERSSVIQGVLLDLFDIASPASSRLQLMTALEGIRDIHSNWFSDSFGSLLTEHITHDNPLPVFLITNYARSRPWLMPLIETISIGRIKHLLREVALDTRYAKEAIVSSLWTPATKEIAQKRLKDFRPEVIEPFKDRIPEDIWIDQAVSRIVNSKSVENTYAVFERQLGSWNVFGKMSYIQLTRILQATVQNAEVRESIATPKFLEDFLDYPFRETNGDKEIWRRSVNALKTSDTTKQRLLDKIEMIREPQSDFNDVPF